MDMQKLLDIMNEADQQPVNEAINKDSPLYKEYESLKAKSVKDLKRIYQQNHRIDTSGFDFGGKANIISDILRDRHGVKKLKVLYNESVNEGAYEDGLAAGRSGRSNPRASSIYGPETGEYSRGVADGEKAEKADRAQRNQAYADEKAPVEAMSDDELGNHVADILQRMDHIRDIAGTKEYTSDHRAEFKELNRTFQLAAQVLSARGMDWREFREAVTEQAVGPELLKRLKKSLSEGYTVLPAMDRERYTDREHEGLEGPIQMRNGSVVYYDKSAGKYYDPDTDMYLSDDEYFARDRNSEFKMEESITVTADSAAELQELLALSGLDASRASEYTVEPEEAEAECGCDEESEIAPEYDHGPSTLNYRYETDKDKIIDTIKDRLKRKMGM